MEQQKDNKLTFLETLKTEKPHQFAVALESIKATGNIFYIPHLIDKLNSTEDIDIQNQILEFLHAIKDKDITKYYVEAINKSNNSRVLNNLLQFCWESGFDLSAHGDVFVKLVIDQEYETAIEAFTVVEENQTNYSAEQKEQFVKLINQNIATASSEKKTLLAELIKVIS